LKMMESSPATWTIGKMRAATHRLLRLVRVATVEEREELTRVVVDAAIAQCVQLSEDRFRIPEFADTTDARFFLDGDAVFNDVAGRVFSSQKILDAEARLLHRATVDVATPPPVALV